MKFYQKLTHFQKMGINSFQKLFYYYTISNKIIINLSYKYQ